MDAKMSEEKKEIKTMERFKKESVEKLKEAEAKDKKVINLNKIQKWIKITHFAEKHIKLCDAVIEKSDELYEAYESLWDASTPENVKKYEEIVKELDAEFKKAIEELLKLKKRYKKDKKLEDIKRIFKNLSKIPKFFQDYKIN